MCRSKEEVIEFLGNYESDDVFIIGGESIYKEFLPYCDEVYVTKIDKEYTSDRFFPNLDIDRNWEVDRSSEICFYNDIEYRFCLYKYMHGRNV